MRRPWLVAVLVLAALLVAAPALASRIGDEDPGPGPTTGHLRPAPEAAVRPPAACSTPSDGHPAPAGKRSTLSSLTD